MNWEKIRKKYKKSYQKYIDWQNSFDLPFEVTFKNRDLYDFFDQNGIRLFVVPVFDMIQVNISQELDIEYVKYSNKEYESRVDAEYAAFEKGFELLEKKLK